MPRRGEDTYDCTLTSPDAGSAMGCRGSGMRSLVRARRNLPLFRAALLRAAILARVRSREDEHVALQLEHLRGERAPERHAEVVATASIDRRRALAYAAVDGVDVRRDLDPFQDRSHLPQYLDEIVQVDVRTANCRKLTQFNRALMRGRGTKRKH